MSTILQEFDVVIRPCQETEERGQISTGTGNHNRSKPIIHHILSSCYTIAVKMPVYHIYGASATWTPDHEVYQKFSQTLSKLHAETFQTDPKAVRVSYFSVNGDYGRTYGGYGYVIAKAVFSSKNISYRGDYMVAYLDFSGPREVLQEYFRKVTEAYGTKPPLTSIYLQRIDGEFEFGRFQAVPSIESKEVREENELVSEQEGRREGREENEEIEDDVYGKDIGLLSKSKQ